MLMQSLKILLILLIYNSVNVASFFEGCDTTVNLTPATTHTFQSKNYSIYDTRIKYAAGTSCVVQYIAPHGYIVRVTGIIALDLKIRIPNCSGQGQRFFISRNGNKKFSDADVFCGTDTIDLDSVGHQMSVGYISDIGGQGRFQVFANAVKIRSENCNCGWGLFYVSFKDFLDVICKENSYSFKFFFRNMEKWKARGHTRDIHQRLEFFIWKKMKLFVLV